jgi:hypothetical protein
MSLISWSPNLALQTRIFGTRSHPLGTRLPLG